MSLVQMDNGHEHQRAEVGISAFILPFSIEGTAYQNTLKTLPILTLFSSCTCKHDRTVSLFRCDV